MRAVNLLPEKHRPRQPTGGGRGSSYVLLGVLATVVLATLMYVLTLNTINSSKSKIAQAKAEAQRFDAQAQALGPFGNFAQIKTQRVAAVRQLAQGRFDWERMVRELAGVLPDGVWLQKSSAADSPADAQDGSGSSTPPASGGQGAAAGGPVLTLTGCARDQSTVAVTLVRLRQLQGAEDVKLDHSTQPDEQGGSASAGSGSSSGGGGESCGGKAKDLNYAFQIDVTFAPQAPAPSKPGSVPARLGGGS
jgi:Tfp pilus assembly protein PilN